MTKEGFSPLAGTVMVKSMESSRILSAYTARMLTASAPITNVVVLAVASVKVTSPAMHSQPAKYLPSGASLAVMVTVSPLPASFRSDTPSSTVMVWGVLR